MEQIKPSQLGNTIGTYYSAKIPLFIYGGYGIGKSSIIKQKAELLAKEKGKEFVEWNKTSKEKKLEIIQEPSKFFVLIDERLSQYEPSDLKGLPKFDNGKENIEWAVNLWLVFITKPDADGIVFFDEMNLACPSVLASCYQIFHDRIVNENKISDDIFIIGAGNRLEDKCGVYEISEALKDRKGEVELVISGDEWFEWALKSGISADIIAFLKFREDYLLKIDEDRQNKSITPRGWERTSKLIENCNNQELLKTIIASSIGEGVAIEFLAFLKLQDKIDLDEVLRSPELIRKFDEVDLKYSLISAISKRFTKDKKILPNVLKICKELEPEFSVLLLKFMIKDDKRYLTTNLPKDKLWKDELSKEYGKYLFKQV